jgi:hypothetical protein
MGCFCFCSQEKDITVTRSVYLTYANPVHFSARRLNVIHEESLDRLPLILLLFSREGLHRHQKRLPHEPQASAAYRS